jgi:hypothetical protein
MSNVTAKEREAILAAEAEAEEFYGAIEKEENERVRLEVLHKVCATMWKNRNTAEYEIYADLAKDDLFTNDEMRSILTVAENMHFDAEPRAAMRSFRFTSAVARLYRTMKTGYYFENLPATELLLKFQQGIRL